jgi:hypothetical protein
LLAKNAGKPNKQTLLRLHLAEMPAQMRQRFLLRVTSASKGFPT